MGERQHTDAIRGISHSPMGTGDLSHNDGIDNAFRSAINSLYGGYSKRRPMDAKEYPVDGGMSYRDMFYAKASIRKMYGHKFKLWVLDEKTPFELREKTVAQGYKYFNNNLMRCYDGERAFRLQEIYRLLQGHKLCPALCSRTR